MQGPEAPSATFIVMAVALSVVSAIVGLLLVRLFSPDASRSQAALLRRWCAAAAPAKMARALEGWALPVVCQPHRKLPEEGGAGAQWSYGCQVHLWTPVVPCYQCTRPLHLSPNLRNEIVRCSAQRWLTSVDTELQAALVCMHHPWHFPQACCSSLDRLHWPQSPH